MRVTQTEKSNNCPYCSNQEQWQGFQEIGNLKDTGWIIYRHTDHTTYVNRYGKTCTSVKEDVFLLSNKKRKSESMDILQLDKNDIPCPRCRQKLEHAQKLIHKKPSTDTTDVVAVCDHCLLKSRAQKPCSQCSKIIEKFLPASKAEQTKPTHKYLEPWLTKMKNTLKENISGVRAYKDQRSYSEINISLLSRDTSKISTKCNIQDMFHSDVNLRDNNRSKQVIQPKKPVTNLEKEVNFKEVIETFQTKYDSAVEIMENKQESFGVSRGYDNLEPHSSTATLYKEKHIGTGSVKILPPQSETKQITEARDEHRNKFMESIPYEIEDYDLEKQAVSLYQEKHINAGDVKILPPQSETKQITTKRDEHWNKYKESIPYETEDHDLEKQAVSLYQEKHIGARSVKILPPQSETKQITTKREEHWNKFKESIPYETAYHDLEKQAATLYQEKYIGTGSVKILPSQSETKQIPEKRDEHRYKYKESLPYGTEDYDLQKQAVTLHEEKHIGTGSLKLLQPRSKTKQITEKRDENWNKYMESLPFETDDHDLEKQASFAFAQKPQKAEKQPKIITSTELIKRTQEKLRLKAEEEENKKEEERKRKAEEDKQKKLAREEIKKMIKKDQTISKEEAVGKKTGESRKDEMTKQKPLLLEQDDFEKDKQQKTEDKKKDKLDKNSKIKDIKEKEMFVQSKKEGESSKLTEVLKKKELQASETKQIPIKDKNKLPKSNDVELKMDQIKLETTNTKNLIYTVKETERGKDAKSNLPELSKLLLESTEKKEKVAKKVPPTKELKTKDDNLVHEPKEKNLKMNQIKLTTSSTDNLICTIKKGEPEKNKKTNTPELSKLLLESAEKKEKLANKIISPEPEKKDEKQELPSKKEEKVLKMNQVKLVEREVDDLILQLIRIKPEKTTVREKAPVPDIVQLIKKKRRHKREKPKSKLTEVDASSDESDLTEDLTPKLTSIEPSEPDLIPPPHREGQEITPMYIQHDLSEISSTAPVKVQDARVARDSKKVDPDACKGVIRYALSDRTFIEKGWTVLPVEKILRKMNVYRMRPAQPEFDWFERNKSKGLISYDTGEKLAEVDNNGRGRWFYKNGRLALDYYEAKETNTQQRFVVYSNGEPDERGRSQPTTILATFDHLGNGVVFDHAGKIRLKYNQTEGVLLDRSIGPVTNWKWHALNDPPVLQQVMIDTKLPLKDPNILKMGGPADKKRRPDNEEMLAIEFDNFIRDKSKKLTQKFKPFQIKMKALKINNQFSLKVLDQATIYLIFRDGSANLKLNIGMILDHKEIVDTDTAELGEVSNSIERFPARTDSLATLQRSVAYAQRYERMRIERDRKLRHPEPCLSIDNLVKAASRPLRPPLRTLPTHPSGITCTSEANQTEYCKCRGKQPSSLYYNTQVL